MIIFMEKVITDSIFKELIHEKLNERKKFCEDLQGMECCIQCTANVTSKCWILIF